MGMVPHDNTLTHKLAGGGVWVAAESLGTLVGSAAAEDIGGTRGVVFDGTSAENVGGPLVLPASWTKVKLTWYHYNATAGSGGVVLQAALTNLAAGGALDGALTLTDDVTVTAGSVDDLTITEGSNTFSITAGGFIALAIGRDPADAADTLAADYGVLGVLITPVEVQ